MKYSEADLSYEKARIGDKRCKVKENCPRRLALFIIIDDMHLPPMQYPADLLISIVILSGKLYTSQSERLMNVPVLQTRPACQRATCLNPVY